MIFKSLTLSRHARERAKERFGIANGKAEKWYIDVLKNSVVAYVQEHDGRTVFQHRTKEIFTVVDIDNAYVFTTIEKPLYKVTITSPFLDPIVPVLERELEKMESAYKRQMRELQREQAAAYIRKGELMMNHTRVNNPKTKTAIALSIAEVEDRIMELQAQVELTREEYERAEVKLAGFIRTSTAS